MNKYVKTIFIIIFIIILFKYIYHNKIEYFENESYRLNIINLFTDKERLKRIKNNCDKNNVKYNIIRGIDGLEYKLTEKDKIYLSNVNYDININKGVVGCHLSHVKLLEKFVTENKYKYLIVCEDDIEIIESEFNKILKLIFKITRLDFDIIYLSSGVSKPQTKLKVKINNKYSLYDTKNKWHEQGNRLYIITSIGAKYILNKYYNGKCKTAVDWFFINEMKTPLVIYPSLAKLIQINSSIRKRKISFHTV